MFGMFKKKPLEVKYGRENYLLNPNSYEVNDENWILLLSSVFVEAVDMDTWIGESVHDTLVMYDEEKLSKNDKSILKDELSFENVKVIKEYMDYISDIEPREFEDDIYYVINCSSLAEVKEKAQIEHDDDDEKEALYKSIWKKREVYEKMNFRLGFISYIMWQVRLAALFGVIHSDVAWKHLHTLADFARPLMTLFPTWEAYNQNILYFYEIYTHDEFLTGDKFYDRAIASLSKREESPMQRIPVDFGVDKNYSYNIKTHSYKYVQRVDFKEYDSTSVMLSALLEKEDKTQLWKILDEYTLEDRNKYIPHLYENIKDSSLTEEDYLELPELYPDVPYAYYIRGEYFYNFAWEARGSGVSSTVGEENYELFYERLGYAIDDYLKAHELAPNEQTYWAELYDLLAHMDSERAVALREKFYTLIYENAMNNYYCISRVSRWKESRWGGSHEENLDWAREVIAKSNKGDTVRRIIFNVLIERYDYILAFDENEKKANAIFSNNAFKSEVNQYFDELIENIDEAPYAISSSLIFWYVKVGDWQRLRAIAQSMKEGHFNLDFMNDEYNEEYTELYLNWLRSV